MLRCPNSMLKELGLLCCFLDDEDLAIISNALAVNTTLESLDLSFNHDINPEGFGAIAYTLRCPTSMLTELNLSHS